MQIEAIRLKNFRAFRDVDLRNIPRLCVLVGANGTGKSTLLSVFAFLRDAMATNVTAAQGAWAAVAVFRKRGPAAQKAPLKLS